MFVLITCSSLRKHAYRAWLRTRYRPSPFKDLEQVKALLSLYTEQQQQGDKMIQSY